MMEHKVQWKHSRREIAVERAKHKVWSKPFLGLVEAFLGQAGRNIAILGRVGRNISRTPQPCLVTKCTSNSDEIFIGRLILTRTLHST